MFWPNPTLPGDLFKQIKQKFCCTTAQRGEILSDEQMQQFANVVETTNVTNCVAKVEPMKRFAYRVVCCHFARTFQRDRTMRLLLRCRRRCRIFRGRRRMWLVRFGQETFERWINRYRIHRYVKLQMLFDLLLSSSQALHVLTNTPVRIMNTFRRNDQVWFRNGCRCRHQFIFHFDEGTRNDRRHFGFRCKISVTFRRNVGHRTSPFVRAQLLPNHFRQFGSQCKRSRGERPSGQRNCAIRAERFSNLRSLQLQDDVLNRFKACGSMSNTSAAQRTYLNRSAGRARSGQIGSLARIDGRLRVGSGRIGCGRAVGRQRIRWTRQRRFGTRRRWRRRWIGRRWIVRFAFTVRPTRGAFVVVRTIAFGRRIAARMKSAAQK